MKNQQAALVPVSMKRISMRRPGFFTPLERLFWETYGVDPTGLVFWGDMTRGRGAADGSLWPDLSGNGNDMAQGTAANQPSKIRAAGVKSFDYDGNDFLEQEAIASHAGLTSSDSRCSFASGLSWVAWNGIDLSAYASNDGICEVVVEDSAGKTAKAYIGDILGAGESWGSNLFDTGKGDFDDGGAGDTEGWAAYGTNTVTTEDLGGGDYALKMTGDGSDIRGAYNNLNAVGDLQSNMVVGKRYEIRFWSKVSAGALISIQYHNGTAYRTIVSETETTLTERSEKYNVLAGDSLTMRFGSVQAGETIYLEDMTLKAQTDCAATGIHVTTTPGGATEGWATVETGFDYNAIVSIEIRKAAFSITGDLTAFALVRLDDGQPAAHEVLLSKYDGNVGNQRAILFMLRNTGKLRVYISDDGVGVETEETNAAVFSNGQSSWALVGFSYETDTPSCAIYVNGSAVASTGGINSHNVIHDSTAEFIVGMQEPSSPVSYLNGQIAVFALVERALSAAEHKRLYDNI